MLHRNQLCGSRDAANSDLELRAQTRYGMALKRVSRQIQNASVHVILSSCLLFIAIEMLQGRKHVANEHLKAGLKLLQYREATSADSVTQIVQPIFTHLVVNASRAANSDIELTSHMKWSKPIVSERYTSCAQAWNQYFEVCVNRPPADIVPDSPYVSPFRDRTWQIMRDRVSALEQDLAQGPVRILLQLRLLKAYYHLTSIALKCNEAKDEMAWDKYVGQFEKMVDLAAEICYSPHAYKLDSDEPDFDVSPGAWALLSLIGMCCRDPQLRRRAQVLLNVHHQRCGHDDEDPQAAQLSHIFALEEADMEVRSCADVPTETRVRFIGCDYTQSPQIAIIMSRWPCTEVETITRHVDATMKPAFKFILAYPAEEAARNIGFQGLMRPRAKECMCKVLDAN